MVILYICFPPQLGSFSVLYLNFVSSLPWEMFGETLAISWPGGGICCFNSSFVVAWILKKLLFIEYDTSPIILISVVSLETDAGWVSGAIPLGSIIVAGFESSA